MLHKIKVIKGKAFISILNLALMNLENISFGEIAAESEIRNLKGYFIETSSFNRVISGKKTVVIGRKGSGKTAIAIAILGKGKPSYQAEIIEPDKYPWEFFSKFSSKRRERELHMMLWKLLILIELSKLIVEETSKRKKDSQKAKDLKKFLQKNNLLQYKSQKAKSLRDRIESVKFNTGFLGIEAEIALASEKDLKPYFHHITGLSEALYNKIILTLSHSTQYFLLFDELDRGWDCSKDKKDFIIGLFQASKQINDMFRSDGFDKVSSVVFLRSDIYRTLQFEGKGKLMQSLEELKWSKEQLIKIIANRIRWSLNQELSTPSAISRVFTDEKLAYHQSLIDYMIRLSFKQPRHILLFAIFAHEIAIEANSNQIGKFHVQKAEEKYSETILQELSEELQPQFSEFKDWMEILRSIGRSEFEGERFIEDSFFVKGDENPIDVLKTLFDFGILGLRLPNPKRRHGLVHFKYEYESMQVNYDYPFVVHDSLRTSLGLIGIKRKSRQVKPQNGQFDDFQLIDKIVKDVGIPERLPSLFWKVFDIFPDKAIQENKLVTLSGLTPSILEKTLSDGRRFRIWEKTHKNSWKLTMLGNALKGINRKKKKEILSSIFLKSLDCLTFVEIVETRQRGISKMDAIELVEKKLGRSWTYETKKKNANYISAWAKDLGLIQRRSGICYPI